MRQVKLIDATPIGINVRSTVATYANVHDELRKIFARTPEAKALGYKAGDFSYNTGRLRCPVCDGTGVDQPGRAVPAGCGYSLPGLPRLPVCQGGGSGRRTEKGGRQAYSLPELMDMDVNTALAGLRRSEAGAPAAAGACRSLGLGYLTLGEETPSLSGGEAQRLKLASEMGKAQADTVFVFDEPTIGLHPLDVQTLLGVFQTLMDQRGHGGCHRARPGRDPQRRLYHRHGPRGRRERRTGGGRGHACGTAPGPGEHHRQVSMREIPCFSTKKYGCSGARLASGAAVLCKGYVTK